MQTGPRVAIWWFTVTATLSPYLAEKSTLEGARHGASLTWIKSWRFSCASAPAARVPRRGSRLADRGQRRAVAQFDAVRRWNADRAVTFEPRHDAAHGLDRQTEVVGDIIARHRQVDRAGRLAPLEHIEQKCRDPLGRAHPPQHKHPDLRVGEVAQGHIAQAAPDPGSRRSAARWRAEDSASR